MATLKQEYRRDLARSEFSRLKKKFGYDMYRQQVDIANEPVRSNPEGDIIVAEFSDFECPFCFRSQAVARQLREKYGDRLRWVMKDFPLSFHKQAMLAHVSANCINEQNEGLYWKFFDGIFSDDRPEDVLSPAGLDRLAVSLGVDMERLEACRNNPAMEDEVREDIAQGEALGVTGTPAFFINGRLISGAQPIEEFLTVIEEEL